MDTLIGETVKISYSRTFKRMGRAELFAREMRSPEIFHIPLTLAKCAKDKHKTDMMGDDLSTHLATSLVRVESTNFHIPLTLAKCAKDNTIQT